MRISPEDIDIMAEWSKLLLDEQEKKLFLNQLNKILGQLTIIEELELAAMEAPYLDDGTPSYESLGAINSLREDRVTPSLDKELVLKNAPNIVEGMFEVPSILE